jgi:predicted phage terminase large subunit-like protein
MLRIASDEDRLVHDSDLVWYKRNTVLKNRSRYNFYITTDFATSAGKKNDFSVIGVWAYTNNGDWLLVDGVCKRQLMDKNIDDLFRFAAVYRPLSVGIEINGQQKGFISWIKEQQITRNIFFNLAKQAGSQQEGIRRVGDKITSFKLFVPTIKAKKLWIPEELKDHELVVELQEELRFATEEGFKSKHDDVADMVSQLIEMQPFKPSAEVKNEYVDSEEGRFAWVDDDDDDIYQNSTVF